MKRKTTKEIIAESFRELAEKKPVDRITIQEIVDNCDYSMATFYRHFSDKYDLIAWDYVYRTNVIMDKVGVDNYVWKDTIPDAIDFYLENKEYIRNLIRYTSGHDAFIRYMAEANTKHLTNCILKLKNCKELDGDTKIYIKVYCYGTVQMLCEWIMEDKGCSGERLAEIFIKAVPEPLKPFLTME